MNTVDVVALIAAIAVVGYLVVKNIAPSAGAGLAGQLETDAENLISPALPSTNTAVSPTYGIATLF